MKTLMVYFSWSNNTLKIVEETNKYFHYDVVRIESKIPYSKDYNTCAYVEAKDEWEKRLYPEIKQINLDYSLYNRILLFFPIWWYTFPMPVGTFIKNLKNYDGEVYVFANSYTNDPKYMENVMKDLKLIDNTIDYKKGVFNQNVEKHIKFIKEMSL